MAEQLSALEQAFGFEDEAFRQYMLMRNIRSASPSTLAEISSSMEVDTHPIVRYAAGWAAADIALARFSPHRAAKKDPHPLADWQTALRSAQTYWSGAEEELRELRKATRSPAVWDFEVKSGQALAYIPSIMVAAHWFSGQELEPVQAMTMLQKTKQDVVKLGSTIASATFKKGEFLYTRNRLCYKIAAGLLIQAARPLQHVVVPTTLRLDHNERSWARGDLMVISALPGHHKTLVEVSGDESPRPRGGGRVFVSARQDLALTPDDPPLDTLLALAYREVGLPQEPHISPRLDAISQLLLDRVVAYDLAGNG